MVVRSTDTYVMSDLTFRCCHQEKSSVRLNTLRYFFSISGPLPQTVEDFWRMIQLTKAELIIMTTMIVEEGKVCSVYAFHIFCICIVIVYLSSPWNKITHKNSVHIFSHYYDSCHPLAPVQTILIICICIYHLDKWIYVIDWIYVRFEVYKNFRECWWLIPSI